MLKNKTDVDNDKTNSIKKQKNQAPKNGYTLVIHLQRIQYLLSLVTPFQKSNVLAYATTGIKDSIDPGVYIKKFEIKSYSKCL